MRSLRHISQILSTQCQEMNQHDQHDAHQSPTQSPHHDANMQSSSHQSLDDYNHLMMMRRQQPTIGTNSQHQTAYILTKPRSKRNFVLFKQRLKADEVGSGSQIEMKVFESNLITTSISQIYKGGSEDPPYWFKIEASRLYIDATKSNPITNMG